MAAYFFFVKIYESRATSTGVILPLIKYLPFKILLFFPFNLFIIVELLQFNAKAALLAEG